MLSWRLGLKANALYRDGSKLSQPLSAGLLKRSARRLADEARGGTANETLVERTARGARRPARQDRRRADRRTGYGAGRGTRQRRATAPAAAAASGYTQKAIVGGHKVYLAAPVNTSTAGSARSSSTCTRKAPSFRSLMNNFAIAISIGHAVRRAARGIRRGLHLHALRALGHSGRGQRSHQDERPRCSTTSSASSRSPTWGATTWPMPRPSDMLPDSHRQGHGRKRPAGACPDARPARRHESLRRRCRSSAGYVRSNLLVLNGVAGRRRQR